MTGGQKRFLILLALMLSLWHIMQLSSVQDAFLRFLAVGQIPGTDVVLSPKSVFILLAVIFALSLVLIFRKEMVRSIARGHRHVATRSTQSNAVQPIKTEKVLIIARPRRIVGVNIPEVTLNLKDRTFPILYIPPIRPAIWRLMDWEMRMLGIVYRQVKVINAFVGFYIVRGWCRLEPRIRRWDKMIEKRIRKNHVVSELIEIAEECWRVIASSRRKTEKF